MDREGKMKAYKERLHRRPVDGDVRTQGTYPMSEVSTFRLYLLRAMYLFMAAGLAIFKLPALLHPEDLSRLDGVVLSMLGGFALLTVLGIRYQLKMLPLLLFELLWKSIWVLGFGLPLLLSGGLRPETTETLTACLMGVVLVPLVTPWGYVLKHYLKAPQVIPVYTYFIQRYPDISSLATATRDELHAVLFSLGLRQRIDALHALANEIMLRFAGQVPLEKEDLLSLPGVSEYIAGAVRCFALDEPEPLIDTNTVRVFGRLFGLEIKDSSHRNPRFKSVIADLVDPVEPRAYNYALLDLASLVCTKTLPPVCGECPVRRYCLYGMDPATEKRS